MNKEEFGKWDLREARRFLECFCKVECSEGTGYHGKSTELKEYDGTSYDSKGSELKGSENSYGRINIRVFSDKKGTGFKGKNLSFNMNDFPSKSKILMAHNEANRGIFFVVNSGGNSDRKINKINAQFFECDTLSLEDQMENISKFPLEPSIIVQTKKSLHVYFLIKDGKVEKFREIQKKLAKHFKGDGSCINESRVMRVPGFYHCKEEPIRVKCIKFNPNLFYTQEDLGRELSYSESEFIVNDDKYIKKEEIVRIRNNLSEVNLQKSECTSNLLSEIGIENNSKNLESYISNYHSDLQESTLLNKENISISNEESLNNKSKEQVLYESEENLHSRSEDNISKNNQLNIKSTEDSLPSSDGQDSMSDTETSLGRSRQASRSSIEHLKSSKESYRANEETTDKNGQAFKEEDKQVFRDGEAYFISGEEEFRGHNEGSWGKSGQAPLTTSSDFYKLNGEENLLNGESYLEWGEENRVEEEVKRENGLEVVCFKCDFIKHCKKNSKTLSEPLWHGMITNLALFKGGTYRIHELSKEYKTYSEEETEGKISNFLKSGAGPMTCETLRDRGYPCKRYGKTCYGKSPASLAFKPLTVKDIRECIKFLTVSEVSNATNVDTALRFIENYMYNIGVALGKSLIEEDLANHLKIKNSKDLISFYREVI